MLLIYFNEFEFSEFLYACNFTKRMPMTYLRLKYVF
jgi:hypothetical protein